MKRSFPEHWVETELNNIIFDVINGDWGQETKTDKEIIKVKIIRGNEFSGRSISLAAERYIKEESYERRKLEEGDIVIEISGGSTNKPVGRVMYVSKKLICETTLPLICSNFYKRIRFSSQTNKNYIFQYLNYFWYIGGTETLQTQTTGLKNLVFNDYISIPIPLPPLNEQKRIAEKLDAILPKVKSAKDRLEKIPAILKKFRQSVLAAACSGKLTEDWREEYAQHTGKELPEWEEKKIFELTEKVENLNVKNINLHDKFLYIDISSINNIKNTIETHKEYSYYEAPSRAKQIIKHGDVLFSNVRVYLKNIAIVDNPVYNDQICSTGFTVLRAQKNKLLNKYLFYSLIRDDFIKEVSELQVGSSYPAIKKDDLISRFIPLPPLEEQQEIVRRVEKLFALADSIEEKYKKAYERVEKLEQAILAKAFRGELVEPDPNDEPAEELLKRILEEKAKLERDQRGKKRKK